MKYVISILEHELKKERGYASQHAKLLRECKVSDRQAFEMSVRMAEERIPQLEKALEILKRKSNTKSSKAKMKLTCPNCNGEGGFIDYELTQGCCGNANHDGSCCGNAIAVPIEVPVCCEICKGHGCIDDGIEEELTSK